MGGEEEGNEDLGLANLDYFRASECSSYVYDVGIVLTNDLQGSAVERPLVQNHQPPHILRTGLVGVAEVEKLFDMYVSAS